MSTLTISPKPGVFSAVPHFENAVAQLNEKKATSLIESLGKIFVKHGAFNDFGLSMVHRHFDMSAEEILVETINDKRTLSVATPWKLDGSSVKPVAEETWKSHGLSERKFVVPQNWFFDATGDLVPFEFLALDDQNICIPSKEFAQELFTALKELGLEKLIGVRRITFIKDLDTWESTPDGARANVTALGERPEILEHVIQVLWYFGEDGRIREKGGRCSHCVYRC